MQKNLAAILEDALHSSPRRKFDEAFSVVFDVGVNDVAVATEELLQLDGGGSERHVFDDDRFSAVATSRATREARIRPGHLHLDSAAQKSEIQIVISY